MIITTKNKNSYKHAKEQYSVPLPEPVVTDDTTAQYVVLLLEDF